MKFGASPYTKSLKLKMYGTGSYETSVNINESKHPIKIDSSEISLWEREISQHHVC